MTMIMMMVAEPIPADMRHDELHNSYDACNVWLRIRLHKCLPINVIIAHKTTDAANDDIAFG